MDRGHYRPPLFYYIYTHISNYQRRHQGTFILFKWLDLSRNQVVLELFKRWNQFNPDQKQKYVKITEEYTIIPSTKQRQDKEKIRGRYTVKHSNPRDFYFMMNRGYERDLTPCIFQISFSIDDSNKVIIDRLTSQWNSLSDELKKPYLTLLEEDNEHYKEMMNQDDEK